MSDKGVHDGLRMEQLHAASRLLGEGSVEQNLRASNLLLCMLHGGTADRSAVPVVFLTMAAEGLGQQEVAEVRHALRSLPAIMEHVGEQDEERTRLQFLRNSLVMVISRLAELSRTSCPLTAQGRHALLTISSHRCPSAGRGARHATAFRSLSGTGFEQPLLLANRDQSGRE